MALKSIHTPGPTLHFVLLDHKVKNIWLRSDVTDKLKVEIDCEVEGK